MAETGTSSGAGGHARWQLLPDALTDDIAITIASSLEASDVCALASCSRFWRALCASDSIWRALATRRWPALALSPEGPSLPTSGWRDFYINKHKKMADGASMVIKFVDEFSQNESLEVGYFLKAIGDLFSMEFGFKDVQMFLFARKHNALLNLIGLHYSILWLGVPPSDVMEALEICKVSDRQVLVRWFKLGRWFYGFRLPDECCSRRVSLGKLTTTAEEEVLGVLNRGAVYEVLRVQITSLSSSTSVSC